MKLKDLYIDVKYKIAKDCIYYVLDCKRIGRLRLHVEDILVEYKASKIYVKLPNTYVSDETVAGHMSAIHNLLQFVGDYVDLNIELPYYSLFYCLTVYSKGNNRAINIVKNLLNERLGSVAYTLNFDNLIEEVE